MGTDHLRLGWAFLDLENLSAQGRSAYFFAESMLDPKFMEQIWRILEGRDEWSRVLRLNAKPETGVAAGIRPGFVLL